MPSSNRARSLWSLLCGMEDRDRFPELSESELTSLLDQKNNDNTKKATKVALNVFTEANAAYGVMLLKQVVRSLTRVKCTGIAREGDGRFWN